MLKRVLSVACAAALLAAVFSPAAMADERESEVYTGGTLMAVNDELSATDSEEGWFSTTDLIQSETPVLQTSIDMEPSEAMCGQMKSLVPIGEIDVDSETMLMGENGGEPYSLDQRLTLNLEKEKKETEEMQCLYIGRYCTVWGAIEEEESACIQIDSAQAKKIGEDFDSHMLVMQKAFGDHWFDADGDGKVALMCYNIDQTPLIKNDNQTYSGFRAGYFYMKDLIQKDNSLGNWKYRPGSYLNGMDMVHVDTYPGMGNGNDYLSDLSAGYSTIIHEFQHLINFTYTAESDNVQNEMETFMNEALSMAAEQHVFGFDAVKNRVYYFNSQNYISGSSLTLWDGSLSSYSNSYLFGQYLRTQYAQVEASQGHNKSDGHEIFLEILQSRREKQGQSTLSIAADLLDLEGENGNTPELQLIQNFWKAVFLKEETGAFGFDGEAWAYSIVPKLSALSDTEDIENGGVKYYTIPENGVIVRKSHDLLLSTMEQTTPLIEGTLTYKADVSYPQPLQAVLTLELNQKADLYLSYARQEITDKSMLNLVGRSMTELVACPINISLYESSEPFCVSFYLKNDGTETEIKHIWLKPSVQREETDVGVAEILVSEDANEISISFESEINGTILVTSFDENGRMLECHLESVVKGDNHPDPFSFENSLSECSVSLFILGDQYAPATECVPIVTQ